jgi:hypothetical protein
MLYFYVFGYYLRHDSYFYTIVMLFLALTMTPFRGNLKTGLLYDSSV